MSLTGSLTGQRYAYGYGRVGVLQEYLLTQQDVERLLAAVDEAALTRALMELKMAKGLEWTNDAHRFIDQLERWLRREMHELVPAEDEEIFGILWLKSDASLLAYLLKKELGYTSGISVEPQVGATAFDPDLLRRLVAGSPVTGAPASLVQFVQSVRADRSLTPQRIDTLTAQFVADESVRLAAQSGSAPIRQYVAHHVDLQNIRTSRRLSSQERPLEHLLRGGEIAPEAFTDEPERLVELVRRSSLPNTLIDSLRAADDASVTLERGLAKAIAHDLALMRDRVLCLEPLFAFAAIALSQLRVLRTLIVGKSAGLAPAEIRNLLPPFLSTSPYAD
jgi:vacuolar-type H+-ATPase subunit C/Vma6